MIAATLESRSFPGMLDENAAHRLGRGDVEMGRVVEGGVARADEPEVGLVHQGGRLQRVLGALPGHLALGRPAQLVVDERQQLLGGPWVALADGIEQPSNITRF